MFHRPSATRRVRIEQLIVDFVKVESFLVYFLYILVYLCRRNYVDFSSDNLSTHCSQILKSRIRRAAGADQAEKQIIDSLCSIDDSFGIGRIVGILIEQPLQNFERGIQRRSYR